METKSQVKSCHCDGTEVTMKSKGIAQLAVVVFLLTIWMIAVSCVDSLWDISPWLVLLTILPLVCVLILSNHGCLAEAYALLDKWGVKEVEE